MKYTVDDIELGPWDREDWHGDIVTVGECSSLDFTIDDVESVLACWSTDATDWDGESAAVVQLRDGRHVAWETWWGPTGTGFCQDAYGGDTAIIIGSSVAEVLLYLGDEARSHLEEQLSPELLK